MPNRRLSVKLLLMLFLTATAVSAWADSGQNKGRGNGAGNNQAAANHGYHSNKHDGHGSTVALSIDVSGVRSILRDNRAYWGQADSLPPGIRKNLARGKPLPPGIARKLDQHLLTRLPHYEGYDWRQVGQDLVLISVASGIIYEVLSGVFD